MYVDVRSDEFRRNRDAWAEFATAHGVDANAVYACDINESAGTVSFHRWDRDENGGLACEFDDDGVLCPKVAPVVTTPLRAPVPS